MTGTKTIGNRQPAARTRDLATQAVIRVYPLTEPVGEHLSRRDIYRDPHGQRFQALTCRDGAQQCAAVVGVWRYREAKIRPARPGCVGRWHGRVRRAACPQQGEPPSVPSQPGSPSSPRQEPRTRAIRRAKPSSLSPDRHRRGTGSDSRTRR
jgi:hypothetical protein